MTDGARRHGARDSKSQFAIRPMTKVQRRCRRCGLQTQILVELASATPLNESKISGEQTTVTTSSLDTMATKRKHKSADDDRMQADSLKKGKPGNWTSENGNELQKARPTRAGVSDEVAQEFQVISNGNANIERPQVNFQNEISDLDECGKAANVTAMPGHRPFNVDEGTYHRAEHDHSRRWSQYGRRWRITQ